MKAFALAALLIPVAHAQTFKLASTLATTPVPSIENGVSAVGYADSVSALNAAIAGGGVELTVDGKYGLGSSLVFSSNTTIHCINGGGFIMLLNSNAPMYVNAHPSTPTTPDGNGGFVVSNIIDHDITIDGCVDNFNSTEAITEPTHKMVNGLWVFGHRFLGVRNLSITNNAMWDSPTYQVAADNVQFYKVIGNTMRTPFVNGLAPLKNTDCIHTNGPALDIEVAHNDVTCGDDSIAFNADDGYRAGSPDPLGAFVSWPGWTWGIIDRANVHDNYIRGSEAGVRILSAQSRVDHMVFDNNTGYTNQHTFQIGKYILNGNGNVGSVAISRWNVQRGTSTQWGIPASIYVDANTEMLTLDRPTMRNVTTSLPYFQQAFGSIGILAINGLTINNTSGTWLPLAIQTNGNIGSFNINATNWYGSGGALIGGNTVPSAITVSNYASGTPLLAQGYSPAVKQGDAFPPPTVIVTNPASTSTYLSTTFNESPIGSSLAGTAPATMATPSLWADGVNGFTYTTAGVTSGALNSYATINISAWDNYKISFTAASPEPPNGLQILLRYSDSSHFDAVNFKSDSIQIADVTPGATASTSVGCSGANVGTGTVSVAGMILTVTTSSGCSATYTLPNNSNSTATRVGINNYDYTGSGVPVTLSAFSVTKQ